MFIKSETPNIRIGVCSISNIFQYSAVQHCTGNVYEEWKPQIQELVYAVSTAYFNTVQYNTVQGMFIKSENPKYKNWCMQYLQHISVQCSTTLYRVCLLKVKTPNTRNVVCSINNIFQFNILLFKLIVNHTGLYGAITCVEVW